MNLLLHGLDAPEIDHGNSLRCQAHARSATRERVDVILTNPPFGGEEEKGIQDNFPRRQADLRDGAAVPAAHHAEAAAHADAGPARAVVVPNGTLFGDGVCARIKEELLTEFNLHTIVRLPNGVFAPYTSIPTNILFFDRLGPTSERLVLRAAAAGGPKQATRPSPCSSRSSPTAWTGGSAGERAAWKVPAALRRAAGRTAATSTARTRAPRSTSSTYRPRSWSRASSQKGRASPS